VVIVLAFDFWAAEVDDCCWVVVRRRCGWATAVAIKKLKNANIKRLRFMMSDDLNDIIS
jgi:hypothetical protein